MHLGDLNVMCHIGYIPFICFWTEPMTVEGDCLKLPHQFQKNNLLPYFEGSSLPSMVGLGSGRGLEW